MSGKKQKKGPRNTGGRRNDGSSLSREKITSKLAIMGMVWDTTMSTQALKQAYDEALMRQPPVNYNGQANSDAEHIVLRLGSEGLSSDDALDIIDLLKTSGRVVFWAKVPEFDKAKENRQETSYMKMLGYGDLNASSSKLRKIMGKDSISEAKAIGKWRTW